MHTAAPGHLGRHFEPAWLGPLGAFRMTCE